jgi:ADP-ribosylglycohydrolase
MTPMLEPGNLHEDRCIGCLLGTACGDILGAAVEGMSAADIRERYGELRDFTDSFRGLGCYTDDTEMTAETKKPGDHSQASSTFGRPSVL